jgi:hypothetical protein
MKKRFAYFFMLMGTLTLGLFLSHCKKEEGPTNVQTGVVSCDNFPPPPGERWVYGILQGTQYFPFDTLITEAVSELVGGYRVYRVRHRWYPAGLGDYVGCNPQLGKVRVASDWWDSNGNHGRTVYSQAVPITGLPFGTAAGTTQSGVVDGDTLIVEVISYSSVTVPAGTYQNVMKVKFTVREPNNRSDYYFDWFDQSVGSVRQEYPLIPATLELLQYRSSG